MVERASIGTFVLMESSSGFLIVTSLSNIYICGGLVLAESSNAENVEFRVNRLYDISGGSVQSLFLLYTCLAQLSRTLQSPNRQTAATEPSSLIITVGFDGADDR